MTSVRTPIVYTLLAFQLLVFISNLVGDPFRHAATALTAGSLGLLVRAVYDARRTAVRAAQ